MIHKMPVRVLLLTCLAVVAAHPKIKNSRKPRFLGGVAVQELLAATGGNSCSVVFVTDASTVSSVVVEDMQNIWQSQHGASLFRLVKDHQEVNKTVRLPQLVLLARQVRQVSWCTMVVVVSHDPVFLAAFAERSLRRRLLIWSTRLVVVTRLPLPLLHALLPTHWAFSMMNTVFFNIEGDNSHLRCVGYAYLPYSPSGARVEKVATWRPQKGMQLGRDFLPFTEKFVNFYGSKVNFTAQPFMPFWGDMQIQAPDGHLTTKIVGSDYQLFVAVADTLNFTLHVLPTKSWAEATELVEKRISFVCPVHHLLMTVRAEIYDYTFAYEYVFLSFAMAKPGQEPQWQSLYYPLSQKVWLAVAAALLLVPLIHRAVIYIQHLPGKAQGVGTWLEDIVRIFLAQNVPHQLSNNPSSTVLLTAWLLYASIIGLSYRGNLIAYLTVPKYRPRPETLPQLVEAVHRVTMPGYGISHLKFFRESESPLLKALASLLDIGTETKEGLHESLQSKQAHLGGRRYLQQVIAETFTEADGSTRLYVGREYVFPGLSGWPIPHDAPYKPQLDRWMMAAIEAGLYEKWVADTVAETKSRSKMRRRKSEQESDVTVDDRSKRGPKALSITHVQGAFLILMLGFLLPTMALVGESL